MLPSSEFYFCAKNWLLPMKYKWTISLAWGLVEGSLVRCVDCSANYFIWELVMIKVVWWYDGRTFAYTVFFSA